MNRYLRIFSVLVVLVCLLSGCAEKSDEAAYTVYQEDGCWYIKTDAGLPQSVVDAYGDEELLRRMSGQWRSYESVSQLREEVLGGGLHSEYLQWLQCTAYPDEPIPICDMDTLYEASVPEGLAYSVWFKGDQLEYRFRSTIGGLPTGAVYVYYNREDYQNWLKNYEGGPEAPQLRFDGELPNKAARTLFREQGIAVEAGALYYEMDAGNGVVYVCEPPAFGNSHGRTMEIFGEKDSVFFRVVIRFQGVVPTVRWLAQFSITELGG